MRAQPVRRPWWPALASAACLGYFALLLTSDLRRPEPLGLTVTFGPLGMQIADVTPASAADRAGFRAGERVVREGGVTIHRRIDALAADTHLAPGVPVTYLVEGPDGTAERTLVPQSADPRYWLHREGAALVTVRAVQLVTLVLACFLLFKRPRDRHAILGAWLLASVGIFSVTLPYGFSRLWLALPSPVGVALFAPYVMSVALAAVGFTFFATFPRPLIRGPLRWVLVWLPMAAALGWHAHFGWRLIYSPERVPAIADWTEFVVGVSIAYGIGLVTALVLNYRRLSDVNDRRRLKVLVAGTLIGSLSGGPVAALYWIGPGRDRATPLFASPVASIGVLLFLAFPLSFAYAILRHRLFDVSVIVRRGLQYALARRALVSAVPALGVLLAVDLLIHGDRPLIETLRARGAVYAVLAMLAIVAHRRRESWLDALDRRFFRERYSAQQILRRIAQDVRAGVDMESIGVRVVAQIESALHPAFVALLCRARGAREFRGVAVSPRGHDLDPLAGETRLLALMGVLRRPANVSRGESAWIRRELPDDEEAYLTRQGIELLVPAGSHALLALGAKQSEEPYSAEDEDLLSAIGESLALRLTRDEEVERAAVRAFEECPDCGTCYDSGTGACAGEGTPLRPVAMPRLLANRYRLDRRLGHGGMGTVYAALDTALSRRVAAKVIRDELLVTGDAGDRFQREARLAAALTHPNIVTVYDFGVFERRAFFVMELLEGATLRQRMQSGGPVTPARAVVIVRGVCAAVDAAHQRQLVHRDLKPENIFLAATAQGEAVKVLDFGVAKMLAPAEWTPSPSVNTADGVLVGTLPYMAPEQLRGEAVSAAWDLWALAVIVHEVITGRHPFAGLSAAGTASSGAIQSTPAECPGPLRLFFARALSVDPSERPESASAFLSAFEQAVMQS
jgi:eukaryotic-like serine/threonine-protein kinase